MSQQDSEAVGRARSILAGRGAADQEIGQLIRALKGEKEFHLAQRLLSRVRAVGVSDPEWRRWFRQQHALCTYKDHDLPWATRLERALEILEEEEPLSEMRDQETLGIAGAIHKNGWQRDGQRHHLERALGYYRRGYQEGPKKDLGYTGINAAYVLDLLAAEEGREAKRAGATSETAERRRAEARRIREHLIDVLAPLFEGPDSQKLEKDWWYLVTVAEGYFGLGDYEGARPWLERARQLEVPEWEYESTVKQLASLARLQTAAEEEAGGAPGAEAWAWDVLYDFLGANLAIVQSAFTGQVGLALSGGGFRASLFHIGVLARLAEHDLLRSVEVLSCVSGGSIIGAHYYLEVRKLLHEKEDHEITRQDYLDIVRRVADDFLAGVQRNVRMRVAANPITNLRMIFQRGYSRTERAGELFEEEIFSLVEDGHPEGEPRWLNGLYIQPKGETVPFRPKDHNWRRRAKVPILILNATTLNTGHVWQFTASWMGEPPITTSDEVDGNYRLRRLRYRQAPDPHQQVRLGYAVAASACVPGLFEPIVLTDLYERRLRPAETGSGGEQRTERLTVRLVDGGVHDNQGVFSLLEQDCTVALVSDASGQMESQDHPGGGLLGVPLRSNNILMARVREAQYLDLASRRSAGQLRGVMFVHLKKDLDVETLDWIGCEDPYDPAEDARPVRRRGELTCYGIRKEVQAKLAAIRTDLDSFCDAEAYALMTSGYRMTARELPDSIEDLPPPESYRGWKFLAVEKLMRDRAADRQASSDLMQILEVARHRAFKLWKLSPPLMTATVALGLAALVGLGWLVWQEWSRPLVTVGTIGTVAIFSVVGAIFGPMVVRVIRYRKTLSEIGIGAGIGLLGWIVAGLYLLLLDGRYLERGKLDTVLGTADRTPWFPLPGRWFARMRRRGPASAPPSASDDETVLTGAAPDGKGEKP